MRRRSRPSKNRFWLLARPRSRSEHAAADELFALMDDIVVDPEAGLPPEHLAPETLATARETQAMLSPETAHLDLDRQQRIWEDIMSATSLTAPRPASAGHGHATRQRNPATHARGGRFPNPITRPLVNAAFAIVLVVAILGGAKMWMNGGNGEPPPSHQLAAPVNPGTPAATPAGTPKPCPFNCDYALNAPPVFWSFHTLIPKQLLVKADLASSNVQLLDWRIAPGATVAMPADDEGGVIVETVIDGAAVITVDGPTVVLQRNDPTRAFVVYAKAGEKVELSRGDTITYSATHQRLIVNPLSITTLHMKSAVFFNGNAKRFVPQDVSGVTVNPDGERAMAKPLSDFAGDNYAELSFELTYIQIHPGTEVPETRNGMTRVLGPVDAVSGPAGSEGYFIWIGPPMG